MPGPDASSTRTQSRRTADLLILVVLSVHSHRLHSGHAVQHSMQPGGVA